MEADIWGISKNFSPVSYFGNYNKFQHIDLPTYGNIATLIISFILFNDMKIVHVSCINYCKSHHVYCLFGMAYIVPSNSPFFVYFYNNEPAYQYPSIRTYQTFTKFIPQLESITASLHTSLLIACHKFDKMWGLHMYRYCTFIYMECQEGIDWL